MAPMVRQIRPNRKDRQSLPITPRIDANTAIISGLVTAARGGGGNDHQCRDQQNTDKLDSN